MFKRFEIVCSIVNVVHHKCTKVRRNYTGHRIPKDKFERSILTELIDDVIYYAVVGIVTVSDQGHDSRGL